MMTFLQLLKKESFVLNSKVVLITFFCLQFISGFLNAQCVNVINLSGSLSTSANTSAWTSSGGWEFSNETAINYTNGAGTYFLVCYDATNTCYSPARATVVTVKIMACLATTQPMPSTQLASTLVTGIVPTDVTPTGGTGPYTYTNLRYQHTSKLRGWLGSTKFKIT